MSTYKDINTFKSHYSYIIEYEGEKTYYDALEWLNNQAPNRELWGWHQEEYFKVETRVKQMGGPFGYYKHTPTKVRCVRNHIGFNDRKLAMMFKLACR